MAEAPVAVLMVAVGFQLAFQAPVNRALGRSVGPLPAVFVSFLVGAVLLAVVISVSGDLGRVGELDGRSPLLLLGGVCGAAYVTVAALTVGRIGAGAVASATVAGQLIGSLLVDGLGLFGIETRSIGLREVIGGLLLVIGTVLVAGTRPDRAPGQRPTPAVGALPVPLLVFAVVAAGLAVGFQHPLNSNLADSSGDLPAALVNFLVGSIVVGAIVFLSGSAGGLREIRAAPTWTLAGGPIGAVTVLASLATVPALGATALVATTVAGQLGGSIAIDRFGLVGLPSFRITALRWLGLALLALGTFAVL